MMCVEIRLVSRGLFVVDFDTVEVESEARMEMICEQVFSRVSGTILSLLRDFPAVNK